MKILTYLLKYRVVFLVISRTMRSVWSSEDNKGSIDSSDDLDKGVTLGRPTSEKENR